MEFYDIDDQTMINLENIDAVSVDRIGKERVVIVTIGGKSYKLKQDEKAHQEFFTKLIKLGVRPNKQFVSL